MSKIFISYRREDSAAYAGRLCDHLTPLFGDDGVFMDVEDIAPGRNFAEAIDGSIGDCNAVLAVIGPKWLDCLHQHSKENEPDYVAHELAVALARKITIIPVLVGGARTNEFAALPPALADLSFRQAVELRDATFKEDCHRLAKSLGSAQQPRPKPPPSFKSVGFWAAGLAALMLLLLVANWAGIGPWRAYRERAERVRQLLRTGQAQINLGEYEPAFKTYDQVLRLDSTNRLAREQQVNTAMLWVEHFHVLAGEKKKAEDLAGPQLEKIMAVLDSGLARANGHDSRTADILAHLGWAHWLNEHIAYKEFGQIAEQGMRQALSIDPANVYANAMLGNWMLQKNKSFSEAVQHFDTAVKTGKQRPFVREFQLAGLLSTDDPGARAEITKVTNQMRLNQELIPDSVLRRLARN